MGDVKFSAATVMMTSLSLMALWEMVIIALVEALTEFV